MDFRIDAAFATPLSLFRTSTIPFYPSISHKEQPRCSTNPSTKKFMRRDLQNLDIPSFSEVVQRVSPNNYPLKRRLPKTLQINIGLTCNLACAHCHVDSSPHRSETMSAQVATRLIELVNNTPSIEVVDITGGAPEMHAQFRSLVRAFREMGKSVIDRCNLTVLLLEEQSDLVQFLAHHRVRVVASLPCYTPENVKKQRGNGVFDDSIEALARLNAAGYGRDPSLVLDLVYNPVGTSLPPPQAKLELDYKRELKNAFDIDFTSLICITNMPIKRFADDLIVRGRLEQYVNLLADNFNPGNVANVMCLDMVHVAHDGSFYDCDFNYALDMKLPGPNQDISIRRASGLNVFDIDSLAELGEKRIRTGPHCFGCTAGNGSSCGGILS
ncbi:hypothetical protein BWQ96_08080 [Gracilariopsis chorda]|uniref:Radical SAM core domain-containing protein n=1 Tax=Gracilariopsis chorda TaxID=448386 RepID=A0A2V3IM07_9FLOR|nr:hypothetical protein BWQ96_08080 [Gracilariopsis chorda]|eukprot:PXF42160.1 hypothetical protein BWQ96_08080 [Gracilariopsis chorda]